MWKYNCFKVLQRSPSRNPYFPKQFWVNSKSKKQKKKNQRGGWKDCVKNVYQKVEGRQIFKKMSDNSKMFLEAILKKFREMIIFQLKTQTRIPNNY